MSSETSVEQIVAQWSDLYRRGQHVAPQDLCMACPELLDEVERRIQYLEETGTETAEADAVTNVDLDEQSNLVTVIEEATADDDVRGALQMQQNYSKLRYHTRGGLGEIYIADDCELQRDVVLKFIRPKHRDRPLCREQFRLEAEVTARLDHPGVVPVYGFGETADGRLCYAMRFIQGQSLDDRIAQLHAPAPTADKASEPENSTLEFRSLITRFVTVCQTIA